MFISHLVNLLISLLLELIGLILWLLSQTVLEAAKSANLPDEKIALVEDGDILVVPDHALRNRFGPHWLQFGEENLDAFADLIFLLALFVLDDRLLTLQLLAFRLYL